MPIKSALPDLDIPNKDLLSFVFDEPPCPLDQNLYISAEDETSRLTFGGVVSLVKKIGYALKKEGLRKNDAVLVFSPNQLLYPSVIYGIMCCGAVFTGANPTYTASELTHQLTHSGSKMLIVDGTLLPVAMEAAKRCNFPVEKIFTFEPTKGARSLSSIISEQELDWHRITDPQTLSNTTAIILYSSGTTGLPKGVELSHRNVVANTLQAQYMKDLGDEILVKEGHPKIQAPYIGHLPMFHAYGLMQACNIAMRAGSTYIITRKFELVKMLELIQKYKIEALNTVPPVVTLLAKHPIVDKYNLKSLRAISSGAAPLGPDVQAALRLRLGNNNLACRLQQGWGMSECTCVGISMMPSDDDDTGSIGQLLPSVYAKLIDDEGNEIVDPKPDDRGELLIKGPQVMKGYLNNPGATKDTMEEGWLKTGDIATVSADRKKFYIVDRKKELIKSKGLQVAPAELESILLSHNGIADACVIGVPFQGDEAPRAYLVKSEEGLKNGVTPEDIMSYMETRVARFKMIRGGVVFLDAIPKSASGKLLRRTLREQAKKEMSSKL